MGWGKGGRGRRRGKGRLGGAIKETKNLGSGTENDIYCFLGATYKIELLIYNGGGGAKVFFFHLFIIYF